MTEILIAGDWHGNHPWAKRVITKAKEMKIDKIIQVGDFGIWPGEHGGNFLDYLSSHLVKLGVKVYFVPGNHEDWNQIESWDMSQANEDGHLEIRPNLFYAGKVNAWSWEGKRFVSAGGAVSIDRKMRILNKSWWPQEEFNNADLYRLNSLGQGDYLFTHDAPTGIPMRDLKPDVGSDMHRQMMNRVGQQIQPKLWFHGHYHQFTGKYSFMHSEGYANVYGLDADDNASYEFDRNKLMRKHVLILNIENNEVRMID